MSDSTTSITRPDENDPRVKAWQDRGASPSQAVALTLVRDLGVPQSRAHEVYGNTKGAFGVMYNAGRRAVGLGNEISGGGSDGGSATKAIQGVQFDPFAAMRALAETQLGQIDAARKSLTTEADQAEQRLAAVGTDSWTAEHQARLDKAIADAKAALKAAQDAKAAFDKDAEPLVAQDREAATAHRDAAVKARDEQLPNLDAAFAAYQAQLESLPKPAPAQDAAPASA